MYEVSGFGLTPGPHCRDTAAPFRSLPEHSCSPDSLEKSSRRTAQPSLKGRTLSTEQGAGVGVRAEDRPGCGFVSPSRLLKARAAGVAVWEGIK